MANRLLLREGGAQEAYRYDGNSKQRGESHGYSYLHFTSNDAKGLPAGIYDIFNRLCGLWL
jgi:hypothetical protein